MISDIFNRQIQLVALLDHATSGVLLIGTDNISSSGGDYDLTKILDSTGYYEEFWVFTEKIKRWFGYEPGNLKTCPINNYGQILIELGKLMTSDGQIQFLGCQIAGGPYAIEGQQLLNKIAFYTGADVWAHKENVGFNKITLEQTTNRELDWSSNNDLTYEPLAKLFQK